MRVASHRVAALALVLCFAWHANACSLAIGYFHQVTGLKGRVVGASLGALQSRWLRRMFTVSGAELEVYEYSSGKRFEDRKPLARVVTNQKGEFEFASLKEGHYTLHIKGRNLEDWFDVEITNKVPVTRQIIIDASPVFPDCTGGHEMEIQANPKT